MLTKEQYDLLNEKRESIESISAGRAGRVEISWLQKLNQIRMNLGYPFADIYCNSCMKTILQQALNLLSQYEDAQPKEPAETTETIETVPIKEPKRKGRQPKEWIKSE